MKVTVKVTVGPKSDDAVGALNAVDWDALREFIEERLQVWSKVGGERHYYPAKQMALRMKAVIDGRALPAARSVPLGVYPHGYLPKTLRKWAKNLVNNVRWKCRSRAELDAMRAAIARALDAVPRGNPD